MTRSRLAPLALGCAIVAGLLAPASPAQALSSFVTKVQLDYNGVAVGETGLTGRVSLENPDIFQEFDVTYITLMGEPRAECGASQPACAGSASTLQITGATAVAGSACAGTAFSISTDPGSVMTYLTHSPFHLSPETTCLIDITYSVLGLPDGDADGNPGKQTSWYAHAGITLPGTVHLVEYHDALTTVMPGPISGTASPGGPVGTVLTDVAQFADTTATANVEFLLFGPNDPTCAGPPVGTDIYGLENGRTESLPFTPTAAGTYRWIARVGSRPSPEVSTSCGDPAQTVVLTTTTPTLGLSGSTTGDVGSPITATAGLTGAHAPTGVVDFKLYGPGDATCTGPPAFEGSTAITGTSATSPEFTPSAVGTYRWTAAFLGDAGHNATSVSCAAGLSVKITRDQTIKFSGEPAFPMVGGKYQVAAAASSGLPVTFSTTSAACSVTAAGLVTLEHVGECVVAADQAGGGDYRAAPTATLTFTIGQAIQPLAISSSPDHSVVGAPYTVTVSHQTGADGNPVTFDLAPGSAGCQINATGRVLFTAPGTCIVRASLGGTEDYAPSSVTQSIDIAKAPQVLTFTSTPPASIPIPGRYDGTFTQTFPLSPDLPPLAVPWVQVSAGPGTTNNACVMVGGFGIVQVFAQHAGTCEIQVSQPGTDLIEAATTITQTLVVERSSRGLVMTTTPPVAPVAGDTYLAGINWFGGYSIAPEPVGSVAPASVGICTMRPLEIQAGIGGFPVDFLKPGTCTIRVDMAGDADFFPAQVTQTIVVRKKSQTVAFTSAIPKHADIGRTHTLTASGGPSGNPVTFSIAPGSARVCHVIGSTVKFTAAGICDIWADQLGNADYDPAPRAVQTIRVRSPQRITFLSHPPMYARSYTVKVVSDSHLPVALTVDAATTNGACTISGATVTYVRRGSCVIAANQPGDDTWAPAPTATQQFFVF